jgi:hypothetical protein
VPGLPTHATGALVAVISWLRWSTAILVVAFAWIVPTALALSPPPTIVAFDDLRVGDNIGGVDLGGARFADGTGYCGGTTNGPTVASRAGGHSAAQYVTADCVGGGFGFDIDFSVRQRSVAVFVRARCELSNTITIAARDGEGNPLLESSVTVSSAAWDALTVAASDASIAAVDISPARESGCLDVDDLTFSPSLQPDTEFAAGPAALNASTSADFRLVASEAPATFACSLDGVRATGCPAQPHYDRLAQGAHVLTAASLDVFGRLDATAALWRWSVDTVPPDTQLTAAPSGTTTSASATLRFTAPDADVVGFECRLDGAAFAACQSPHAVAGLADGPHSFDVRAKDGAGNRDPSPARATWTVDRRAPDTLLDQQPPIATADTAATLAWSSPDRDTIGFQCRLDAAAYGPCQSPRVVTGLAEGGHAFQVRAVDLAGNVDPTPASASWTVDMTKPDVTFGSVPSATVVGTGATFAFSSTSVDLAGFRCQVDQTSPYPCTSPLTLTGLAVGQHSFTVRSIDVAGNLSDPVTTTWVATSDPLTPKTRPPADGDRDGVPDVTDNCPANANRDQTDADADGIGDACELLPLGNVPPVAGERVIVRWVSGDVFVQLPRKSPFALDELADAFLQEPGFVPLKGVAAVPIGSIIDARKGRLAMQSARDGLKGANQRTTDVQLAAGIFKIRQARARRRAARVSTDYLLQTPPGTARACTARSNGTQSLKGVVRSLSAAGKGVFRMVGGASVSTATNATLVTTDRCDGTLTEVGRGRVAVFDQTRRRTIQVRAGRAYLAKAKLFAAKKGR